MEQPAQDYKQLLTDIIKKQMVLLGPDITMAQVKKVAGLTVAEDGTVTDMQGDAKTMMHDVITAFVELSGEIVKKAMEPLFEAQSEPTPAKIELPAAPIQPALETSPTPIESDSVTPAAEPSPVVTEQPTQPDRPLMKVEEVTTPPPAQSLSMPSIDPAPQPMTPAPAAEPTLPQPTSLPVSSEPADQTPAPQPAAASQPAEVTPVPPAQPAPGQNGQQQTDPDMQHIINEALKQTQ